MEAPCRGRALAERLTMTAGERVCAFDDSHSLRGELEEALASGTRALQMRCREELRSASSPRDISSNCIPTGAMRLRAGVEWPPTTRGHYPPTGSRVISETLHRQGLRIARGWSLSLFAELGRARGPSL